MGTAKLFGRTGAAVIAAFVAAAAGSGATVAADLGAPMPMAAPASEPLVEWGSGWYLRGDLGFSDEKRDPMMRLRGEVKGGGKSSNGFGGDLGFGYQFSDFFRSDATFGIRRRLDQTLTSSSACTLASGEVGVCSEGAKISVDRFPMLVNAYADLGSYGGLRPYLGAGVGAAVIRETWNRGAFFNGVTPVTYAGNVSTYGASPNVGKKTRYNFAYALMAGVGYDIRDGVTFDVGYRYLDMGSAKIPNAGAGVSSKLREHEVRVGIRYRID